MTAMPTTAPSRGTSTFEPSSTRLSETAHRLAIPSGIVDSDWPSVREVLRTKMGVTMDPWQDGAGGLLLAKRENGKLAHTVGGFGMSVARQIGKTFMLAGAVFGLSLERPGLLSIWTSHHSRTHQQTFGSMQGFAKRAKVEPHIKRVYTGNGAEEVRFHNGSRILFGAREHGFGRGIPGVDILISDEAQILSERAMQDMLATLNVSSLGLHVYVGTPPKPGDNAEIFTTMREEALSGEATDLVWIEFGADPDANLDDKNQYAKANPSFPYRTPLESILRLRKRLGDDGFRCEGLGIWPKSDNSSFDVARWATLADPSVESPQTSTLMIDVAPNRRWSCIGIAGEVSGERTLVITKSLKGTDKVVETVSDLLESQDIIEVAISSGAARALEPELVQGGIDYAKMSHNDLAAGYAALQEAIKAGSVVHVDQQALNFAIANAKTRYLYSGESEAFDRRGQHVDISPAVAIAGAFYRFGLLQAPLPVIL